MLSWVKCCTRIRPCVLSFYVLSIKQGFCVQTDSASIIFNSADLMNLMMMNSEVIINILGIMVFPSSMKHLLMFTQIVTEL